MTGWGFQLIDNSQITLSPSDNHSMSTQYRIDQAIVLAHRLATLRRKNPAAVDGKDAGADAAISAQVIKLRGGQRSIDKSLSVGYLNLHEK